MRQGAVGKLLVAAVRGDAWRTGSHVGPLAADVDPGALALAAEYHGVPGYARAALLAADADAALTDALAPAYNRALHTHLRALSDLSLVDAALAAAGAPYVTLKGPVLAATVHARADLRAYSDLDVLVAPPFFGRAVRALMDAGCRPMVGAYRALRAERAGELPMHLPSGGALDLHWHTLNSHEVRAAFDVDPAALVGRAMTVDVAGARVPVLDPADTFVYVTMHMVLSGAHRLVWSKDVDRLVVHAPVPWDEVVGRAESARAALVVAYALRHVHAVLGTPVAAGAGARLGRHSPWPWLAPVTARLSRPEHAASNSRLMSRVAARSTRYGVPSSVRQLLHKASVANQPRGLRPDQQPADPDAGRALEEFTAWADAQ